MSEELRKLPSVDELLRSEIFAPSIKEYGRELALEAAREAIDRARRKILAGESCPPFEEIAKEAIAILSEKFAPSILPVINATGVIIHTNLAEHL